MAKIIPDNQIAAGNNNAAGLTLVTSLQDDNGINFLKVRSLPFRNRGQRRYRLDGTVAFIGAERVEWRSSAMTVAQYDYLIDNYEGLVTIRHPTRAISGGLYVFANYNAILELPDEQDLEYIQLRGSGIASGFTGPGYKDVVWVFRKLEAL